MDSPETVRRCPFCLPIISEENWSELKKILPSGYTHLVCATVQPDCDNNSGMIRIIIRLQLWTQEAAEAWMAAFQEKTRTTYRAEKTYKSQLGRSVYKKEFCCQHHPEKYRKMRKSTGCRANVGIGVLEKREYWGTTKDPHIPDWIMRVRLRWPHNHPLNDPSMLRYRDVGTETLQKIETLLSEGFNARSVHTILLYWLEVLHGDRFQQIAVDRKMTPEFAFVQRVHTKFLKQTCGPALDKVSHAEMVSKVERLSAVSGGDFQAKAKLVDGEVVIALTTPLMERAHRLLPQSGQFVFVDCIGQLKSQGYQVRLLTVQSPVGGLPLGCLISTSDSAPCLEQGLQLLMEILPPSAFYSRGTAGPVAFLTQGRSPGEHQALATVFPLARQMRSPYHELRSLWALLWCKSPLAQRSDRRDMMNRLKEMLYCTSIEELEEKFETFTIIARDRRKLVNHFTELWKARSEWATPLTRLVPPRDHWACSFAETALYSVKSNLWCWYTHKKGSLYMEMDQAFVYLSVVFSHHYSGHIERLLSLYEDRDTHHVSSGLLDVILGGEGITQTHGAREVSVGGSNPNSIGHQVSTGVSGGESIKQLDEDIFELRLVEGKTHLVDSSLGTCTCRLRLIGSVCRHLLVLQRHLVTSSLSLSPLSDKNQRQLYQEIATGQKEVCEFSQMLSLVEEADEVEKEGMSSAPPQHSVGQVDNPMAGVQGETNQGLSGISQLSIPSQTLEESGNSKAKNIGLATSKCQSLVEHSYISEGDLGERSRLLAKSDSETESGSEGETETTRESRSALQELLERPPVLDLQRFAGTDIISEAQRHTTVEAALKHFDAFTSRIKQMLRENPQALLKPLQAYVDRGMKNLDSVSSLKSMLSENDCTCKAKGTSVISQPTLSVVYCNSCQRVDCSGQRTLARPTQLAKRPNDGNNELQRPKKVAKVVPECSPQ